MSRKSLPSDLIRGWIPVFRKGHAQSKGAAPTAAAPSPFEKFTAPLEPRPGRVRNARAQPGDAVPLHLSRPLRIHRLHEPDGAQVELQVGYEQRLAVLAEGRARRKQ